MVDLAKLRNELAKEETKSSFTSGASDVNYPFWEMKIGQQATIRFLPDGNEKNSFFWVDKGVFRFPFQGVVNAGDQNQDDEVTVQLPCINVYVEKNRCPVVAQVGKWFKRANDEHDDELRQFARKYYIKRSWIYQGFVRSDPLGEEEPPENPIRRFSLNNTLHNLIKKTLMNPKLKYAPCDYDNGRDFIIDKDKQGDYASYSGSQWDMDASALTPDEYEAIQKHGLVDLSTTIQAKPTDEEVEIIHEMFKASVEGAPYDYAKWAQYYKPFGVGFPDDSTAIVDAALKPAEDTPKVEVKSTPKVEEKLEPEVEVKPEVKPEVKTETKAAAEAEDLIAQVDALKNSTNAEQQETAADTAADVVAATGVTATKVVEVPVEKPTKKAGKVDTSSLFD